MSFDGVPAGVWLIVAAINVGGLLWYLRDRWRTR